MCIAYATASSLSVTLMCHGHWSCRFGYFDMNAATLLTGQGVHPQASGEIGALGQSVLILLFISTSVM